MVEGWPMSLVEVKCGECGHAHQVEEKLLGTSLTCRKCKEAFIAELGDTYGLADEPAPGVIDRRSSSSSGPGASPVRPVPPAKPATSKPAPKARAETKEERATRERMEKWAEKMDE
jgi:hypothetical protein